MFSANQIASRYEPGGVRDCSQDELHARLTVCQSCSHRQLNECTLARLIASVHARRKTSGCPLGLWPGQTPRPAIERRPQPAPKPAASPPAQAGGRIATSAQPWRPRVGFVMPHFWCGGVERQLMAMIRHSRHLVDWSGVWIGRHGPLHDASFAELQQLVPCFDLETNGPDKSLDLAIVWGFQSAQPWIAGLQGKVIAASHGAGEWNNNQLSFVAPYCRGAVAVSQVAKESCPAGIRDRMVVIPNGIEFDRLTPTIPRRALRDQLGIGNRHCVGYVGRISEEKRWQAAPAAVGVLRRQYGDKFVALMCGARFEGEAEKAAKAEAEQLNPGGNIWVDPPPYIGDIYSALDCMVLGSRAEGSALVVLEAWAAGCPVISTSVGSVLDFEREFGQLRWPLSLDWTGEEIASQVQQAEAQKYDGIVSRAQLVAWDHCSAALMGRRWGEYLRSVA